MVSIVHVCVLHEPITILHRAGWRLSKKRRQIRQIFGHLHCIIYLRCKLQSMCSMSRMWCASLGVGSSTCPPWPTRRSRASASTASAQAREQLSYLCIFIILLPVLTRKLVFSLAVCLDHPFLKYISHRGNCWNCWVLFMGFIGCRT